MKTAVMLLINLLMLLLLLAATVSAITRNERGALKLLYWATSGRRWAAQWDIQNEHSDPCLDNVREGLVCSALTSSNAAWLICFL
jgi:hypothetical protein